MSDGRRVTVEIVRHTIAEELAKLKDHLGPLRFQSGRFEVAGRMFEEMMTSPEFPDFMTLVVYKYVD